MINPTFSTKNLLLSLMISVNMGRWSYSNKTEADDVKKITTSFLKKHGYFQDESYRSGTITWTRSGMWGESKSSVSIRVSTLNGDGYLNISYTQTDNDTGEKKDFDYKIPLTTTSCNFGGVRYWFMCSMYKSGVYCGKRVGVLYKDGDFFACRHCYELTYASKKVNRSYRYFPLFNILNLEQKIEELNKQIKRPFYNGRPTKKQRKLDSLYDQIGYNYRKHTTLNGKDLI